MNITHAFMAVWLSLPLLAGAQDDPQADAKRFEALKAKRAAGTLTDEERQWGQQYLRDHPQARGQGGPQRPGQQRGAMATGELRGGAPTVNPVDVRGGHESPVFVKAHPPRDHTGLVPIAELGKQKYQGEEGGLYPGGVNEVPPAHLAAGSRLAEAIVPLDAEGHKSPDGKIVFLCVGMSSATMEFQAFLQQAEKDSTLNPKLVFVDGAQNGQTAFRTQDPTVEYWKIVDQRIGIVGATPKQVQAVWYKQADANPTSGFPTAARTLQMETEKIMGILHDKFPSLKIVYLSNRIYGGYARIPMNPEPYAYETSFAAKWAIGDQIAGKAELNYDPAKGEVRAPWMVWGPDLWADGVTPRKKDGLIWNEEDCLKGDRTHPSMAGRAKVAKMLMDLLKSDPTSRAWFLK